MVSNEELSKVEFFSELSDDQLKRISTVCEYAAFDKRAMLFREGDRATKFYILQEGKVVIQIQLSSRPTTVSVSVINKPYESLGWSCIVPPYFYTASAVCEENSRFIAVEGQKFVELLQADPEVGVVVFLSIAQVISARLRNSRTVLLKSI